LGNGRNAWKSDWTSDEREVYDLLIFGSGVKGRALSLAARLRRRVSRRRSVEAGLDNATD
jgi:CelD/BcsL family acetyltransferase involved in cellulose biosynthesis